MAIIAPFKGITYNSDLNQDIAHLVTPPYDVINTKEQKEYYLSHPYNMIRLILGKKEDNDTDRNNTYTRAAAYFDKWQAEGILTKDAEPCIYLTSLTYDPGEGMPLRTRWGIIALVRIEDAESGVILPHEKTFSAHKDNRLSLTEACSAQFSQIFALYEDNKKTLHSCRAACNNDPKIKFEFHDGTKHRMWVIRDKDLIRQITLHMKDKTLFIADGHHRYETSRNYRNLMRTRYGSSSSSERSYEYVTMYLSDMDDAGLTILPSHRLIKEVPDFRISPFMEKIRSWFDINTYGEESSGSTLFNSGLKHHLQEKADTKTRIAFYSNGSDKYHIFTLKTGIEKEMGEDLHPALKKLDVMILSRLILQKALGLNNQDLNNENLFKYESSLSNAISNVKGGKYQMAFLLNPTKIEHVKEIARNSLVMPRKSTYFFPKILDGLVLNKLDPNETIQNP